MRARGAAPDKDIIRECVTRRVCEIAQEAPEGNRMRELALRLKADGVEMVASKNATHGEASNGARSESEANAERVSPLRGGETSA